MGGILKIKGEKLYSVEIQKAFKRNISKYSMKELEILASGRLNEKWGEIFGDWIPLHVRKLANKEIWRRSTWGNLLADPNIKLRKMWGKLKQ
jgi:hypothetical protein